jgi:hypothetical protein
MAAESFVLARVKIPFHRVAFPEMIIGCAAEWIAVECAQSGVKRLVIPHVEKLCRAVTQSRVRCIFVFNVRLKIFHWRGKRVFEFGKIAVYFHPFRRARGNSANTFLKFFTENALANTRSRNNGQDKRNNFHKELSKPCKRDSLRQVSFAKPGEPPRKIEAVKN